jgi:hypothetical protein
MSRRHFDRRAHAVENLIGRYQRLADGENAASIGNDDIGEGLQNIRR